ncbi:glycerol-3-phosphate acyltransferase [Jeotgalibacillus proteolyticus]|uniref:Glycerol-3-phosphate acyltransferase n=1 Tax=Jeotgalibacillus proteolyticus TaxID=2082395 RepID=A0A2S5GDI3_9BACL|nr:glycerol-3-phosphate acyltransferase [Jeotgalibacillus proteolyticus]PPA71049.1 glycerol-3-phosphate acyltransferase [Jeotgalibacillus proteolyticus]
MWAWPIMIFLCTGINGAFLVTRFMRREDIRHLGSGTAGARNAGRVGGKKAFIWTVIIDAGKTIIPLSIALWMEVSPLLLAAMVAAAVAGHIWPIWLKGRGGKGVVVYLACVLVLEWPGLLLFGLSALIMKWLPVSFSNSMLIMMAVPVVSSYMRGQTDIAFALLLGYALVIFAHVYSDLRTRRNIYDAQN